MKNEVSLLCIRTGYLMDFWTLDSGKTDERHEALPSAHT